MTPDEPADPHAGMDTLLGVPGPPPGDDEREHEQEPTNDEGAVEKVDT